VLVIDADYFAVLEQDGGIRTEDPALQTLDASLRVIDWALGPPITGLVFLGIAGLQNEPTRRHFAPCWQTLVI
jgi:hypothetical protein